MQKTYHTKKDRPKGISENQWNKWRRDRNLAFVLKCRNCGELSFIKIMKSEVRKCTCGKKVIMYGMVNHFSSKILYKSKYLESDCIYSFDQLRI